jgi:hypothetical protein
MSVASVAREEAVILSTELAASARSRLFEGGAAAARAAEMEMKLIGIRQAAEATIHQTAGGGLNPFFLTCILLTSFRQNRPSYPTTSVTSHPTSSTPHLQT